MRTFTWKPWPESGLDCLNCAIFARQWLPCIIGHLEQVTCPDQSPPSLSHTHLLTHSHTLSLSLSLALALSFSLEHTTCPVPRLAKPRTGHSRVFALVRFRANRKQLNKVQGLLREREGQNLALTVLHVPYSLDSGMLTIACVSGLRFRGRREPLPLSSVYGAYQAVKARCRPLKCHI